MSGRPHALVTGANRGIGAAIARRLASAGADVTLLVRSRDAGEAIARELPGAPLVVTASVTDAEAVHAAISVAEAAKGPVTWCVNNAGAAESAPFLKTGPEVWQRALDVNLLGAVHVSRRVLPGMLDFGSGQIVMIASTAGLTGYPYVSAYVAAKHAVIGLVRALDAEFGARGIAVNAICPGFTDTDLVADSVSRIVSTTGRSVDAARAALAKANPQGRLLTPDEVADVVRWLLVDTRGVVRGRTIGVDGGELA
ncbi:MAG: SDR family NAD(P)-dependent oxidoreductase [Gemmatimonadaceae bacterium]|nr:SDR family NAD(P)-dependent oxidoreductase [Gemmatimonadaceae bacterium]